MQCNNSPYLLGSKRKKQTTLHYPIQFQSPDSPISLCKCNSLEQTNLTSYFQHLPTSNRNVIVIKFDIFWIVIRILAQLARRQLGFIPSIYHLQQSWSTREKSTKITSQLLINLRWVIFQTEICNKCSINYWKPKSKPVCPAKVCVHVFPFQSLIVVSVEPRLWQKKQSWHKFKSKLDQSALT